MKLLATVAAIAASARLAFGQTVIEVQVGDTGSFFDPPTISALKGDTVRFIFTGRNHSVTQSTFANPCLALPGGFNSGAVGVGANASAPPPIWDLTITNDSAPIWYFCNLVFPSSHCAAGMVGAINPPPGVFGQFTSAARAVSGTPAPSFSPVLSGIGALATNTPLPTPTFAVSFSTTLSMSSFSPPTSSSSSSPSPTAAAKTSSNNAAIIGGAVGGAAAVLVIGILAFLLIQSWRRNKRYKRDRERDDASRFDINKSAFLPPQQTGTSGGGGPEMGHAFQAPIPTMPFSSNAGQNRQYIDGSFEGMPAAARSTSYTGSTSPREYADHPISTASPDMNRMSQYTDARGDVLSSVHESSPANLDVKSITEEVGRLIESRLRSTPVARPPSAEQNVLAPSPHRQLPRPQDLTSDDGHLSPRSPGPPEYARFTSG